LHVSCQDLSDRSPSAIPRRSIKLRTLQTMLTPFLSFFCSMILGNFKCCFFYRLCRLSNMSASLNYFVCLVGSLLLKFNFRRFTCILTYRCVTYSTMLLYSLVYLLTNVSHTAQCNFIRLYTYLPMCHIQHNVTLFTCISMCHIQHV
jgi:hypothetical protein